MVRYDTVIRVSGDRRIWVDVMLVPVRDAAGNVTQIIQSGVDIDERVKATRSLEQTERFNRLILESSVDCIQVLDLQSRLLSMNEPGMCAMDIHDFEIVRYRDWLSVLARILSAHRGERRRPSARRQNRTISGILSHPGGPSQMVGCRGHTHLG